MNRVPNHFRRVGRASSANVEIMRHDRTPGAQPALRLNDRAIRRHGPGNVLSVCWRQWRAERMLARRGIGFRVSDPESVAAAYSAMSEREFEAINGRQNWANWRTIPRSLSGLVPDRPLVVVDLGCGTGDSTRVLACCAPQGSVILGYEVAEPLLAIARQRTYRSLAGDEVAVLFHRQEITEPWHRPAARGNDRGTDGVRAEDAEATLLPAESIDVANASGVVGQHLNDAAIGRLADELRRVLRPEGVAMLDAGPKSSKRELTAAMCSRGFVRVRYRRSSPFDRTGQVVFRVDRQEEERGGETAERASAVRSPQ